MTTICGGKLGSFSAAGSDQVKPLHVTMRMSELERLTEIKISPDEASILLTPLGFKVTKQGDQGIAVEVPSFRSNDVTREVDLVEEVTRLYGYDKVPPSMPKRTIAPPLPDTTIPQIKTALSASGLSEAWTSSLVALTDISGKGTVQANESEFVQVLNPLSEDHQVLRTTLLPGLLKAAAYNQDRGRDEVWLFETGLTYRRGEQTGTDRGQTGTVENMHVSGLICGENKLSHWEPQDKSRKVDTRYYELKGIAENMLDRLSVPVHQLQFVVSSDLPGWFHPSRSAQVLLKPAAREKGEPIAIGWIGEVHPAVGDAYGLKAPAAVFEFSVDQIRKTQRPRAFRDIPNTPSVVRDITADLARTVEAGSVQQVITQVGGKLLQQVDLVSVFDLSDEQKSLSYRLVFQDPEKTLTADEVEKLVGKVRQQLTRQLSASFRT
jgi:phenylalanyl-tRNA synthetase beta chain